MIQPIDITEKGDVLVYGPVGGNPSAGGAVLIHTQSGGYSVLGAGRRPTGINEQGDLSLNLASAFHAGTTYDLQQRIDRTLEEVHAPNNNGQFLGTTHYIPPTGGVVEGGGGTPEHRDDVLVTVPSWQKPPAEAKGPGCQAPAAPQNPDAFAADPSHIQVSWDPPDNSRGVTGYRLYESPANYSRVDPIGEVGPDTFELTVPGDPKSGAHYLIRAIGLGGESHAVVAIAASDVRTQQVGPSDDVFMSLPGLGDLIADPGLVSSPVTIKYRSPAPDGGGTNAGAGDFQLLGQTFSLTATDDNGDPVHQFGSTYLLALHYDPAQLPANTTASAIKLYYYDTARSAWRSIDPCSDCLLPGDPNPDTSTHTVTFELDHMTKFALGVPASATGNPQPPGGGIPSGNQGGGNQGGGNRWRIRAVAIRAAAEHPRAPTRTAAHPGRWASSA